MKPEDKDTTKGTSFWGMVFSAALHATVLILVLFWGFSGTSNNSSSSGPIEVSLSDMGPGGGGGSMSASQPKAQPPAEPEKPKPQEEEPPPVEKKEEVKEVPPEPEKKEVKKVEVKKEEPKEEAKPKEVVKKEPEKKEVIPLETEKKKEVKKEVKKEEPKKEVAEKPKPTEKPKTVVKKTTASKEKELESEKNKVLQDIKRQRILEELKSGTKENDQPNEEMGEEKRLAMADSKNETGDSEPGPGSPSKSSGRNGGGGSSLNPVLLNLYKDKVHQKISRNWSMPPGVPTDGSLVAGVTFRVDQSGRVFDVRINSSSGNAAFDEYCVSAIRRSAPLPAPPSEFAKEAENDGIEVSFRNTP